MGDTGKKVKFDLGIGRVVGTLIRDNGETVIVEFYSERDGQKVQLKRHKEKHNVRLCQ